MPVQNCIYIWSRDHRIHHKFSETDGDPHNTKRGFFFAHVGWLLRKKHPELLIKSSNVSFKDLDQDPVIQFQKDLYILLYLFFGLGIQIILPTFLFFNISFWETICSYIMRQLSILHSTWFINSTAHMFGDRPYNRSIEPRENIFVSCGAGFSGEGYHNYHHTYPHDYAVSELGSRINLCKLFIDFTALIGQAYDLRRVDQHSVREKRENLLEPSTERRCAPFPY